VARGGFGLDRVASEAGHPEHREQEADDAGDDPDPGDQEQKDDPGNDECDAYADHRNGVPAAAKWET
jgi:hypothetical protein